MTIEDAVRNIMDRSKVGQTVRDVCKKMGDELEPEIRTILNRLYNDHQLTPFMEAVASLPTTTAKIRLLKTEGFSIVPTGPKGEKRPADVNARAVLVAKIATGEVEDAPEDDGKDPAAKALGKKGGAARAKSMTPERRAEIAKSAAAKRWGK